MESNRQEEGLNSGEREATRAAGLPDNQGNALLRLDEHGNVLTDTSFLEKLLNWDAMVRELAAIKPFW